MKHSLKIIVGSLLLKIPLASAELNCDDPGLTPEQKLECLLPSQEELIEGSPQGQSTGTSLPEGDLQADLIPFIVNTLLSAAGTFIFISFLYASFLMITANDNEENLQKGKKILLYSVIGAVIMATSYAIIYGIATLDLN